MRTLVATSLLVLTAGALSPLASSADADAPRTGATALTSAAQTPPARALAVPSLRVTRLATGFQYPWDVQPIARGSYLVTTRDSRRLYRITDGRKTRVQFPSRSVWASGETGLMSLEIDPGFASNRRFYTCQGGFRAGGGHDVRVVAWRLNDAGTVAQRVETLLTGIQATSGRHGGCRLLITRKGALLVGTGDAAVGTNPRNLRSFNGKVLRMNRMTGRPWPANPRIRSSHRKTRYIYTWGHRNVQGLAQRADSTLWSVEHGTYRDDEVNRLVPNGDYGYNPVPGYNEDVPMTNHRLPGPQRSARWRSGRPTIATSGATWVRGSAWGSLNGTLAVAALKGSRVVFMKFNARGALRWTRTPAVLRNYGRLRSVTRAPNGDLLITTGNGTNDAVLRVHPRG
jgi:glucose/arabinose dehydrogenase